jgi:hypothetical protein
MILEALEWCLTPASRAARAGGHLSEQIAIRHRARRCAEAWAEHLARTKAFVNARLADGGREVAVLGSGHLHDVDVAGLLSRFERVVLIDAVHPLEVRFRAATSRGRIVCLAADLCGLSPAPYIGPAETIRTEGPAFDRIRRADLVVSVNLLSQLVVVPVRRWARAGEPDEAIIRAARSVLEAHIGLLRSCRRALLISDAAHRFDGGPWEDLLLGLDAGRRKKAGCGPSPPAGRRRTAASRNAAWKREGSAETVTGVDPRNGPRCADEKSFGAVEQERKDRSRSGGSASTLVTNDQWRAAAGGTEPPK